MTPTEQFVLQARRIHGDRYGYGDTLYRRSSEKVAILCPDHGCFYKTPNKHLSGQGCPTCGRNRIKEKLRMPAEQFFARAESKFGKKYSYEESVYTGMYRPMLITCPIHGRFEQRPVNHLAGEGCTRCGHAKIGADKRSNTSRFVAEAVARYGDRFDYSKVVYVKNTKPVVIICKIHGEFSQRPGGHLAAPGCPHCQRETLRERFKDTFEGFVAKAREAHGDRYEYPEQAYGNAHDKLRIVCPTHGEFLQSANVHLRPNGCPRCGTLVSRAEQAIADYLKSLGLEILQSDRSVIAPKELDIVIPALKLAIEYNGLYYHSDAFEGARSRHIEKTRAARAAGYRLVHIFEDEWVEREPAVRATLAALTGHRPRLAAARQMILTTKPVTSVKQFLEDNHLQGAPRGGVAYCLEHGGELRAVMTFAKVTSERGATGAGYELTRFCTAGGIPGAAARLFAAFRKAHPGERVISYSDNRWFTGGMYEALGFRQTHVTPPNYFVVVGQERMHKSNFRHERLKDLLGDAYDASKTERELCHENGWFRVYDCGLTKWEYGQTITSEASTP